MGLLPIPAPRRECCAAQRRCAVIALHCASLQDFVIINRNKCKGTLQAPTPGTIT